MSSVQLTSSMQTNLLQLNSTIQNENVLENQLTSGNKVNSALDNPQSYFAAQSLNQRATSLTSLKDQMTQGISTIQAANQGITQIQTFVKQLQGITQSAYSSLGTDAASTATRANLATQYNSVLSQINQLANDSGYAGKNLVAGNGQELAATSTTVASVNSITGVSQAGVTNISASDTYSLRFSGTGAISGDAGDISTASNAQGLTGLKVSGKLSATAGNFSNITIQTLGAVGQTRTVVVTDGSESRSINFFDNTQSATGSLTTGGSSGVAQVSSVKISGNVDQGDTFSATVNGRTFTYTASAGDVSGSANAATSTRQNNIAAALSNIVSAGLAASGYTVGTATAGSSGSSTFTITAAASQGTGNSFTLAAGATNAASKTISLSFSSGAVVSFTINRAALEALGTAGDTTSSIQKSVDLSITATDLGGASVTRSAANALGSSKLANGENDFNFSTGTVRLNVNANNIQKAASASAAANLSTNQVRAANTQNDLSVQFNGNNSSSLNVAAVNATTSGLGLGLDQAQNGFADRSDIDNAVAQLTKATTTLQADAQQLGTNLSIIQTRSDFTTQFSNVLTDGANSLTQVDQNTASAQLLSLQTKQSLGVSALSLANQSQQAILKLLG